MGRGRSGAARHTRGTAGSRNSGKTAGRRVVVGAALIIAALTGVMFFARGATAHPTPRAGTTAEEVVDHSHYHGHPRIAAVYRQAKEVPHVLDGLHCYCECASHSGHYSLLDCFKSDHGAGCDVCLTSAAMAHQMTRDGKSLDEIRAAVDAYFTR